MIIEGHANKPLSPLHRTVLIVPIGCFVMATLGDSGLGLGWFVGGLAIVVTVLAWAHLRPYRNDKATAPANTQSEGIE